MKVHEPDKHGKRVRIQHSSGSNSPMVCAELGTRQGGRGEDGAEYPQTPEDVNGFRCDYGSLGLYSFLLSESKPSIEGPSYQRLAYVDAYKLELLTKTIGKINRTMAKYREVRGYPTSWAEQVLRFAEATGCEWIAFDEKTLRQVDHDRNMHGNRWAFYATGEARWLLERLADSWTPKKSDTDISELVSSDAN